MAGILKLLLTDVMTRPASDEMRYAPKSSTRFEAQKIKRQRRPAMTKTGTTAASMIVQVRASETLSQGELVAFRTRRRLNADPTVLGI